ncbi:hypothetical protein RTP6_003994 [Batrachochytrium dendrobatidis]
MHELGEEDIQSLYTWIDNIHLSRPKKNISRDFSDGVACAEVVKYFIPKLVDLHNFSPANSVSQKIYNWTTLNQKVFRRLGYSTNDEIIQCIVSNKPGYVEYILYELRQKIDRYLSKQSAKSNASPTGSISHESNHSEHSQLAKASPFTHMANSLYCSTTESAQHSHVVSNHPLSATQSMDPQENVQNQIWTSQGSNMSHKIAAEGNTTTVSGQVHQPLLLNRRASLANPNQHLAQSQHSNHHSHAHIDLSCSAPQSINQIQSTGSYYTTQSQPNTTMQSRRSSTIAFSPHQPTQNISSKAIHQHHQNPATLQPDSSVMPKLPSIRPEQHDKELIIDLQDTINILQLKVSKLEQLLMLKEQQIQKLTKN